MSRLTRRETLAGIGILGTAAFADSTLAQHRSDAPNLLVSDQFRELYQRISETPLVDTHEHLIEESERLAGGPSRFIRADDWTMIFSHYFDSDLVEPILNGNARKLFRLNEKSEQLKTVPWR